MCARCHVFDWDVIEASGGGHIYSYAIHHHPPFDTAVRAEISVDRGDDMLLVRWRFDEAGA